MPHTCPASPHPARASNKDAISLLKADHVAVRNLFAEYGMTHLASSKKALVAEICTALSVHTQIKEEISYPALKDALPARLAMTPPTLEHAGVKELIAQLQTSALDGPAYDTQVMVLRNSVKQQGRQERKELFPKAQATSLDMIELGARLAARRDDLLAHAA